MTAVEVNFDGLPGPTHNYAGLSFGNLASAANRDTVADPRTAALQGIAKMRALAAMGLPQAVLPPHERPAANWLAALGFGADWPRAAAEEPALARALAAASAMWAANAATVSPSADCADGRCHLSVANLATMLHRALEAEHTEATLRAIFRDEAHFVVHGALFPHPALGDEGAANHMRLATGPDSPGAEVFVYGRTAGEQDAGFPARQTLEASRAVARRHGLDPARTLFVRQSADAIAAGAFHNDVVAVAHEDVLFAHEQAFAEPILEPLRRVCEGRLEPRAVIVPKTDVSLAAAVTSYLFNAQLVRPPGAARHTLIVPAEAQETEPVRQYLEALPASGGPIGEVLSFDLRQSMRNGGGPACLRLRVQLTARERAAIPAGFFLDEALASALEAWVRKHYRDRMSAADLGDPQLIAETRTALDELTAILPLGRSFYPFQRGG